MFLKERKKERNIFERKNCFGKKERKNERKKCF